MRPLAVLLAAWACASPGAAQATRGGITQRFDLTRPVARFELPGRLGEVSGLAFSAQGRLLAHGDERGVVYTVDVDSGRVDRGFVVGDPGVADDLEGLATVGDRLFLVSSAGRLYEFRAAAERGSSPVRVTDLGLGGACEVEGLAYLEAGGFLLAACKTLRPIAEEVRVHRLPLAPGRRAPPPLRVPYSLFRGRGHGGDVSPSGIDVDPRTGTLVLVAAREELLFEIDLDGRLLDLVRLSRRRHPQPEGIAFGPDGRLYIADEGGGGRASITVYGPREGVR